jgi:hypothetical protein
MTDQQIHAAFCQEVLCNTTTDNKDKWQPHCIEAVGNIRSGLFSELNQIWSDPGRSPSYHFEQIRILAHNWPTFYSWIREAIRGIPKNESIMDSVDAELGERADAIIEGIYRWTVDTINAGPLKDRPLLGTGSAPLLTPSKAKQAILQLLAQAREEHKSGRSPTGKTLDDQLSGLLPRCEAKDLHEFPDLKEGERCWSCRVWEAIDAAVAQARKGNKGERNKHLDDLLYEGFEDLLILDQIADIASRVWHWHESELAAKVAEALELYERDMQGYDFTPQEDSENTNALVADALRNSKEYVTAQLTPHPKEPKQEGK